MIIVEFTNFVTCHFTGSIMEQLSPTSKKRPFKLFEHSLSQFNDVVIPHRLDMMKKHRCNIEKAIQSGDYQSATREQIAAKTLVQNLKRDLSEIDALRNQVDMLDLVQFDKAIGNSRSRALLALKEYINLGDKLSFPGKMKQQTQSDDEAVTSDLKDVPHIQIFESKLPVLDKDEEEYVRSWERLNDDIQDLHTMYVDLNQMVQDQGQAVDDIEDNVNSAAESVHQGNLNLKRALRYKATTYPLLGAAIGTLVGGPVGLVIGLKAGGCAAVGGGLLGFVGGRFLKKAQVNKVFDGEHETYPKIDEDVSCKPHQS